VRAQVVSAMCVRVSVCVWVYVCFPRHVQISFVLSLCCGAPPTSFPPPSFPPCSSASSPLPTEQMASDHVSRRSRARDSAPAPHPASDPPPAVHENVHNSCGGYSVSTFARLGQVIALRVPRPLTNQQCVCTHSDGRRCHRIGGLCRGVWCPHWPHFRAAARTHCLVHGSHFPHRSAPTRTHVQCHQHT
jgi:hypothetical protein